MPPKLEYHIHNGEGVYTALQETLGIPAGMLSELGGKAVEAKRLAYCKSFLGDFVHTSILSVVFSSRIFSLSAWSGGIYEGLSRTCVLLLFWLLCTTKRRFVFLISC